MRYILVYLLFFSNFFWLRRKMFGLCKLFFELNNKEVWKFRYVIDLNQNGIKFISEHLEWKKSGCPIKCIHMWNSMKVSHHIQTRIWDF